MPDFILLTCDIVNFDPAFELAVVAVVLGNFSGTASAFLDGGENYSPAHRRINAAVKGS